MSRKRLFYSPAPATKIHLKAPIDGAFGGLGKPNSDKFRNFSDHFTLRFPSRCKKKWLIFLSRVT